MRDDVLAELVRSKNLRQPPIGPPAQIIELPQPILRLGIPMREKQIRERFRLDMRNPTLVPKNVGAGTNRGLDLGWPQAGLFLEIPPDRPARVLRSALYHIIE